MPLYIVELSILTALQFNHSLILFVKYVRTLDISSDLIVAVFSTQPVFSPSVMAIPSPPNKTPPADLKNSCYGQIKRSTQLKKQHLAYFAQDSTGNRSYIHRSVYAIKKHSYNKIKSVNNVWPTRRDRHTDEIINVPYKSMQNQTSLRSVSPDTF